MHISFGLDLDGYRSPRPRNRAGQIVTGPNGLLNILENQLGLTGNWKDAPLRIGEYRNCLEKCDTGQRFYSKSFQADEFGVSKTLLFWRDSWVEAGWDYEAGEGDHSILTDLAAVELLARNELSAGFCDRVRSVLASLEKRGGLNLKISLLEWKEELPGIWQKIFTLLTVYDEGLAYMTEVLAEPGTDLARLQDNLLNNTPYTLTGDGTVLMFRAHSEIILAQGLVQFLYSKPGEGEKRLADSITVVLGNSGEVFDASLAGQNHPLTGSAARSHWRPHLQLLHLVLDLIWEPLDPTSLLEFLSHPVNPLPAFVCTRLAREVAKNPGMGGRDWNEALQELGEKAVERAEEENEAADVLRDKIRLWLDQPRYDPEIGVDIGTAVKLCTLVGQWCSSRANSGSYELDRDLYYAASAQASATARILGKKAESDAQLIPRLQLKQLLQQVTSIGSPRPDAAAECGGLHSCKLPGAVIESNDTLLWWDFTRPALPGKNPWPTEVTRQLCRHGAILAETGDLLKRLAQTWQQPLLRAKKHVFLAAPVTRCSEPCVLHPLWEQLNPGEQSLLPEIDIDALLDTGIGLPSLVNCLERLPAQALAGPVRWWRINCQELLAGRERESYSSLQAFLFSPYQWVLRHKARLREGSLNQVQDGPAQQGTILHVLFEELFAESALAIQWQKCSRKDLFAWIDTKFSEILTSCGANLLLPGRGTEREELLETGKQAAWALIAHLKSAEVVDIRMEKHLEADFFGGTLGGYIDMLVTNRHGKQAVIDLKLGGLPYRRKELSENKHLQLATYAYLHQKRSGQWPDQAFFILRNGLLLAQDASFFSDALLCSPGEGEDTLSLWLEFEQTWKWRRKQLNQGLIELTVQGTEADDNSAAPDEGVMVEAFNDRFNDFSALTGWIEE